MNWTTLCTCNKQLFSLAYV